DGDRLAAVVIQDGAIGVVVIDAATDAVTTVATSLRGQSAWMGSALNGSRVAVRVLAADESVWTSTIVDTRSGASMTLPDVPNRDDQDVGPDFGALSRDGIRFASPDWSSIRVFGPDGALVRTITTVGPARDLVWSPDGRRLAFRDGDALVIADLEDETQVSMALSPTDPYLWHRSGEDLIVARQVDGSALVERYRGHDLRSIASRELTGPTGTAGPSDPAPPLCLQLDDDPSS
ncbi:MAG: hypothetical protein ABIQ58_04950, partial [Candidatus Limnocylindrales bacterium]